MSTYNKRTQSTMSYAWRNIFADKNAPWLAEDSNEMWPTWDNFNWGPINVAEHYKRDLNNATYNKRSI